MARFSLAYIQICEPLSFVFISVYPLSALAMEHEMVQSHQIDQTEFVGLMLAHVNPSDLVT